MPILVIARSRSFRRFMGEPDAHRNPAGAEQSAKPPRFPPAVHLRSVEMADEKEVIVTDGGGGGGSGAIIAVVLLVAVLVVLFLVFGTNFMRGNDGTDIKADVKIDTPATNN
jgi:hypothetical protein